MTLQQQYLNALKESQQKELVSKSAIFASEVNPGRVGPKIYAVRNGEGDILGFAEGEPLSPAEIESLISEVSKSAKLEPETDNSIFDDLFNFGGPDASKPVPVEVSKSADDSDSILASIFPRWLQPNFPNQ